MALRAADFKHGDTEFGIFYPKDYVLSVFPDAADADRAVAALRAAGFKPDDLVVATAADVLAYSREMRADPGLLSRFEHFVANLYADEGSLADDLVAFAKQGHTFVATYAPDDAATARVVYRPRMTRSTACATSDSGQYGAYTEAAAFLVAER